MSAHSPHTRTGLGMRQALTDIESLPSPRFSVVAVLGTGLIGGSIALAALRNGSTVHVWDPFQVGLLEPDGPDWVVFNKPEDAVRSADLVVLAGPVDTIAATATRIAPFLLQDAIVTDVGSVKGDLSAALRSALDESHVAV